jgi:hypothetical protein
MKLTIVALLIFLAVLLAPSVAQERFDSGPLKGFTKSPIEHIVVELEKPFEVRQLKGAVFDPNGAAVGDALVELRSGDGQIRGAETDSMGRFQFRRMPDGEYKFKVTLAGFQSVVGVVRVLRKTKRSDVIMITLPIGV